MPITRHTIWMDASKLKGHDRYTAKNPKFRTWMMIVAILALMAALTLMFIFMPGSDSVNVRFSSIPEGAGVFVDGEDVGVTPCDAKLSYGEYTMRMEADGYLPVSENIKVTESDRSFNIIFTEGESEIAFTSYPEDVRMYIGEEYIGRTPFVYRDVVEDKPVTIKAEKTGYYTIEMVKNLHGEDEFDFRLERIMLSVIINSDPPVAELYIDSKHKGQTPWSGKIYYGEHDIRIVKEGGYRIIDESVDVKSDFDVTYPLESKGITIDGFIAESSVPGARVYVIPIISGEVMKDVSPWAVEETTPIQMLTEDMAVYLTHKETVPDRALVIGRRVGSSASAGITVTEVNSIGEIEEEEINIIFPDRNQIDFLGQSVEGISWFSLLSETTTPAGLIENNPRFTLIDGRVVDRDNPDNSFNTGGKTGEIVLSPDNNKLAIIGGGIVSVFDGNGLISSTPGKTAVFGRGDAVFVADGNKIVVIDTPTNIKKTVQTDINIVNLQRTAGFLVAVDADGKMVTVDTDSMKIVGWNQLLVDSYPQLADHFTPDGMFTRNVAGEDNILLLGRVYGVKVLFGLGDEPCLLGIWFDETPLSLEEALIGQGT